LRMLSQAVVVAAAALLQINTAQAAACTPPPEMCANAPAAEAEHCQTLASYLAEFQQEVCSLEVADPSYTPSYSSAALRASGNLGPALLANWSLPRIEQEIDSLAALGAKVVQIEVV